MKNKRDRLEINDSDLREATLAREAARERERELDVRVAVLRRKFAHLFQPKVSANDRA